MRVRTSTQLLFAEIYQIHMCFVYTTRETVYNQGKVRLDMRTQGLHGRMENRGRLHTEFADNLYLEGDPIYNMSLLNLDVNCTTDEQISLQNKSITRWMASLHVRKQLALFFLNRMTPVYTICLYKRP